MPQLQMAPAAWGPEKTELRQIKDRHRLGITAVTDPKAGFSSCARKWWQPLEHLCEAWEGREGGPYGWRFRVAP